MACCSPQAVLLYLLLFVCCSLRAVLLCLLFFARCLLRVALLCLRQDRPQGERLAAYPLREFLFFVRCSPQVVLLYLRSSVRCSLRAVPLCLLPFVCRLRTPLLPVCPVLPSASHSR